ncbi:acyl-CoA/acyl-ACP dehydrogenase [Variovorax sp. LjRoot175]|uniref:acyl-CoA dehydrogenase family protein n=1 Tax=Variovorax sp. LjRoot175 TaxID=3342276 RepID=UPI003ECE911E
MNFYDLYDERLSAAERALVQAASDFCRGEFSVHLLESHTQGRAYDVSWIDRWAKEGFLGLQTPSELGGHDASFICKIRVAQAMAEHGFAAAFAINNLQGSVTRVARSGSEKQRAEFLDGMLSGRTLCAPAMSEPDGGSDLGALKTKARRVDGGWLISGTKSWVTNGSIIQCANLLARVDPIGKEAGETASFLVPLADGPTLRREELVMPGAQSFRLSRLIFQDHFVPDWCLFDPPGQAFKSSMASVNAARVHVAAMCVASARAALAEAVGYAETRQAFGKPLLRHQGLGWELAEVSLRLEAANALVLRAAIAVQTGKAALTLAAQAKKFAVDVATWGHDQCQRAMGAVGASADHRLAMLSSETRLAAFGDGTNQMLLDRIAKGLAKDYGPSPMQKESDQ